MINIHKTYVLYIDNLDYISWFSFLWRYGTADCLYFSVLAWLTWYSFWCRSWWSWSRTASGKRCLCFEDDTHFRAKDRDSLSRRASSLQVPVRSHTLCSHVEDLLTVYITFIRCSTEYCCVVWNSSLTAQQKTAIERIQKVCLKIILGIINVFSSIKKVQA